MIVSIILAFVFGVAFILITIRSERAAASRTGAAILAMERERAVHALRGDELGGWRHERYIADYNWLMAQRELCAPLGQAESWASSKPPARTAAENIRLMGERAQRKADAERQRKLKAQLAYYKRNGIDHVVVRNPRDGLVTVKEWAE